jgi:hypothetical protein
MDIIEFNFYKYDSSSCSRACRESSHCVLGGPVFKVLYENSKSEKKTIVTLLHSIVTTRRGGGNIHDIIIAHCKPGIA